MWDNNVTPWHRNEVHGTLKANLELMTKPVQDARKGVQNCDITFFLPLCGKSVDLLYLYQEGFCVVGCDVEKAAEQFFQDNKLEFKRKMLKDGFSSFAVSIVIVNCDYI